MHSCQPTSSAEDAAAAYLPSIPYGNEKISHSPLPSPSVSLISLPILSHPHEIRLETNTNENGRRNASQTIVASSSSSSSLLSSESLPPPSPSPHLTSSFLLNSDDCTAYSSIPSSSTFSPSTLADGGEGEREVSSSFLHPYKTTAVSSSEFSTASTILKTFIPTDLIEDRMLDVIGGREGKDIGSYNSSNHGGGQTSGSSGNGYNSMSSNGGGGGGGVRRSNSSGNNETINIDIMSVNAASSSLSSSLYSSSSNSPPTVPVDNVSVALQSYSFNQNYTCFVCATTAGFRVYTCTPLYEFMRREKPQWGEGCYDVAGMLFRTNVFALVSSDDCRKVKLWDDQKKRFIGELRSRQEVKHVCLGRDILAMVTEYTIYVYQSEQMRPFNIIHTGSNPRGLCVVSSDVEKDHWKVACPAVAVGAVRIQTSEGDRSSHVFQAHQNPLAALAFNSVGSMVVTASETGTVIRVFSSTDGQLLHELRRGTQSHVISCVAFRPDNLFLAVASSSPTVHIFKLAQPGSPQDRTLYERHDAYAPNTTTASGGGGSSSSSGGGGVVAVAGGGGRPSSPSSLGGGGGGGPAATAAAAGAATVNIGGGVGVVGGGGGGVGGMLCADAPPSSFHPQSKGVGGGGVYPSLVSPSACGGAEGAGGSLFEHSSSGGGAFPSGVMESPRGGVGGSSVGGSGGNNQNGGGGGGGGSPLQQAVSSGSEMLPAAVSAVYDTSKEMVHDVLKGVLPRYFDAARSFAQFHIPGDHQTIDIRSSSSLIVGPLCAFAGDRSNHLYLLHHNGVFYECRFDPNNGNECTLLTATTWFAPRPDFKIQSHLGSDALPSELEGGHDGDEWQIVM